MCCLLKFILKLTEVEAVAAAIPRPVGLPGARKTGYIHLYFGSKGRDREQYAEPLTKRAGGWCEPVSGNAELAREPRA
jgi:hypothetical protein